MSTMQRFHVLGSTATGNFLAHHLKKLRHEVTLLVKDYEAVKVFVRRNKTITLKNHDGVNRPAYQFSCEHLNVHDVEDTLEAHFLKAPVTPNKFIQNLIITIAPYSVRNIMKRLFHRMGPQTTIVLLTEGMGVYEELLNGFFVDEATRPNFLLGKLTHQVYSKGDYHVDLKNNKGELYLAFPTLADSKNFSDITKKSAEKSKAKSYGSPLPPKISQEKVQYTSHEPLVFNQLPLYNRSKTIIRITDHVVFSEDEDLNKIRAHNVNQTIRALDQVWELNVKHVSFSELQKLMLTQLAVDCCLHPLSTIFDVNYEGLCDRPPANRLIQAICEECSCVLESHRQAIGLPQFNTWRIRRLIDAVYKECREKPSHWSPMVHRIQNGGLTDIQYVNGYIVRLGQKYGIPTPINSLIVDLVKLKHHMHIAPDTSLVKEIEQLDKSPNIKKSTEVKIPTNPKKETFELKDNVDNPKDICNFEEERLPNEKDQNIEQSQTVKNTNEEYVFGLREIDKIFGKL
ncbi:hypothetical protein G9A89_020087 [Geosiphon pyriformis]|nr:hypothetical protein G9A89_020087 [Geosiphon pyriformis]